MLDIFKQVLFVFFGLISLGTFVYYAATRKNQEVTNNLIGTNGNTNLIGTNGI